jgi:hypothetical protein
MEETTEDRYASYCGNRKQPGENPAAFVDFVG